jgi:dihydroorotate dehydrogenase electron transfer subunit
MTSYQLNTKILRREELAPGIVRLTLDAPEIAARAKAGQFLMVKASGSDGVPLLRRPFSIHQTSANGRIQLLFKVLGQGTAYLAGRQKGDILEVVGPLGQGFSLPTESAAVCVIGGGLGMAPLFFLVKNMLRYKSATQIKVLLGAATAKEVATLKNDFAELGTDPEIATDDGTMGHRGFVTDLLPKSLRQEQPWQVYTCGPNPMMCKVAAYCAVRLWPCQASLETVMACGISACLGCTVRSSREKEKNSGRPFLHVCKDGPVFAAGDLAWT